MFIALYACVLRHVRLFVTHQAPLSMGFSRQEQWSGLPCPPPGGLPYPGIEPESLHLLHRQVNALPLASPGKREGVNGPKTGRDQLCISWTGEIFIFFKTWSQPQQGKRGLQACETSESQARTPPPSE